MEADLPTEIDRAVLMDTLTALTGLTEDSAAAAVAEHVFLATVGESRGSSSNCGRAAGRRTRARSLANAALAAAIVGIMWAADFDQIPVLVLPAVLPLVVDVERARLNRRDQQLLLQLRTTIGGAAAWLYTLRSSTTGSHLTSATKSRRWTSATPSPN